MSDAVTISFVVPAYNEEKHLARTLTAIIAEIKRAGCAAEVIVVNNASTDGTGALAASFPEVIVVDEPEKGLVQARRAGFLRASGDADRQCRRRHDRDRGLADRVLRRVPPQPRSGRAERPLHLLRCVARARAPRCGHSTSWATASTC